MATEEAPDGSGPAVPQQSTRIAITAPLTRVAGWVIAIGMSCAFCGAIRLAWADYLSHNESLAQVQGALKLEPENAGYWLRWADMLEAEGHSGRAGVERAVQVDPYDAGLWIRAGMEAESRGDYAIAEKYLLLASRRSRQYAPRWALANYYFRRGDSVHFWPWARSAMQMAYRSRDLLFDLCWHIRPDAAEILRLGIPADPKVLRDYLAFLLNSRRPEAAIGVAEQISARATKDDRELLLWYIGVMLEQQHGWPEAISAWNALCLRKIVPYEPLDPAQGALLTNGAFAVEPSGAGFDWRVSQLGGMSVTHSDTPSFLRFDFDGRQPEDVSVVSQFVPAQPLRRYKLRFEYRTQDIPENSGLQWRVANAANGADIALDRTSLSAGEWSNAIRSFTIPAGVSMIRLSLIYERQPGRVRIEGTLWLRSVSLEKQP